MALRFSRVAIVGVGLIGGSLGMAIRERGLAESVVGIGRNPQTLAQAVTLGALDEGVTDFAGGVAGADLVVLATPVPQILTDLARLKPYLAPQALVTDVGSIKGQVVAAGEALLGGQFLGSHPMAGSEKSGVDAARADLFIGATWVLTPTDETPLDAIARLSGLVSAIEARCLTLSPQEHDRSVAVTSHLPHVLAYALSALAEQRSKDLPALYDVAAGSFSSATRVAGSSPELWQGICLANREALLDVLQEFQRDLSTICDALAIADGEVVRQRFSDGFHAKMRGKLNKP